MVHAQIQIFCLLQRARLLRERGDQPIGACLPFQTLYFCFSLITSYFSFLLFYFLSISMLTFGLWFFLEIPITVIFSNPSIPPLQCIARGPLYRTCRDQYLLFQPLTAFVQCGCPYRPLTGHQLFNHHHLFVLAVPLHSARQRRLFCMFACCGFTTHYNVCALFPYPSWHTPSGSNLSLLLLGGMSSQQDISPKRA